jgi:hypothetical protein
MRATFRQALSVFATGFLPFALPAFALQGLVLLVLWSPARDLSEALRAPLHAERVAVPPWDDLERARRRWDEASDNAALLSLVGGLFVQAAIVYAVFHLLERGRAAYARSFLKGASRFFPVLGVVLVVCVLCMGVLGLGQALDLLVVAVPALARILAGYTVSLPVAVVEGGVMRALDRSAWLTAGARWRVLGAVLLAYGLPLGLLAFARFETADGPLFRTVLVLRCVAGALLTMYAAVLVTVVYVALRRAKEGVDAKDLVGVFD